MLKKMVLVLLSASLLAAESPVNPQGNNQASQMSTEKKLLLYGIGAGTIAAAVVYSPVVVPTGIVMTVPTVVTAAGKVVMVAVGAVVKAGVAIKGACVAAGPVAAKINMAIFVAKMGKPLIYENSEDKVHRLVREEPLELYRAREEFEKCLKNSNNGHIVDYSKIPGTCEEQAMIFAMLAHLKSS